MDATPSVAVNWTLTGHQAAYSINLARISSGVTPASLRATVRLAKLEWRIFAVEGGPSCQLSRRKEHRSG